MRCASVPRPACWTCAAPRPVATTALRTGRFHVQLPQRCRRRRAGLADGRRCAPEFAREIFGKPEVGVLPRLVHSRFGLHVVEVLAREPGLEPRSRR
jgi:hypothetical protein